MANPAPCYCETPSGFPRPPLPPDMFAASMFASAEHVRMHRYDHEASSLSARTPCSHPFVEGWDLSRCASCGADLGAGRAAQEADLAARATREDAHGSDHATRLHGWGVRVDWLLAFTYDHDCWSWPTWRIVRDIVKPSTAARRCRYAELDTVAPYTRPATIFMR